MRKIFINQNNIFRAQQNEYLIRKCLCIDNNINTNRILSNGSVNMYGFVPFTSPWCIRRPTELSTTSNRMCRTTLFSSDARSRCSTQLTLAPNWTIKMSSTIDQQRQRVEQEMTKMVDDVDRSFLRKLQVKSLMISSSQAHAFTHYRNMSFLAICIYKYRLYCVVNVIPARNAFMRCQVLWRQKCKHWHCPKLHWTLLAAGESCPTLHPIGNGRISRKIATMRYGMLWRHNISFPFTWIYMFVLRFFQQCNDDIKVQMPAEPSEDQISKYTAQFERCAIKCVDKHIDLIPQMFKTMKSVLSKPNSIPWLQLTLWS